MCQPWRMIRHIVLLKWTEEATAAQVATVATELGKLPGLIPELRTYAVGDDAGISEGNHDFGILAEFDDAEGFAVYRDHPAHQKVIADHIKPILAGRAAIQIAI